MNSFEVSVDETECSLHKLNTLSHKISSIENQYKRESLPVIVPMKLLTFDNFLESPPQQFVVFQVLLIFTFLPGDILCYLEIEKKSDCQIAIDTILCSLIILINGESRSREVFDDPITAMISDYRHVSPLYTFDTTPACVVAAAAAIYPCATAFICMHLFKILLRQDTHQLCHGDSQ